MRQILLRPLAVVVFTIIFGGANVIPSRNNTIPPTTCAFYDGEGNGIPVNAVKLLVRSEFVYMTLSEIDTIQKYFYNIVRHLCPFKSCPMKEQVRFHGCTVCKEGSDCYALDMVHWEHPTWTYDECEEWINLPFTKDSLSIRYIPQPK